MGAPMKTENVSFNLKSHYQEAAAGYMMMQRQLVWEYRKKCFWGLQVRPNWIIGTSVDEKWQFLWGKLWSGGFLVEFHSFL